MFFVFSLSSYCQNFTTIINDSIKYFNDDVEIGLFQKKGEIRLLRIKVNDSTFLYKEYSKSNLFKAYQCNLSGLRNGYFYTLDTINLAITSGFYYRGMLIQSNTINKNSDTIAYIKKINDTLIICMEIKDGIKKIWQLNSNYVHNGYYKTLDLNSGRILVEGHYLAVKEIEITDKKKYTTLLEKYKLSYVFRGEENMTEVPIGTWYFYDKNGGIQKTVKYDWEGIF
jgi:hypothetical protein